MKCGVKAQVVNEDNIGFSEATHNMAVCWIACIPAKDVPLDIRDGRTHHGACPTDARKPLHAGSMDSRCILDAGDPPWSIFVRSQHRNCQQHRTISAADVEELNVRVRNLFVMCLRPVTPPSLCPAHNHRGATRQQSPAD
jgi:hypothetical protein